MKKTLALILALVLTLSAVSALAASKAVKIDKKNFPDAAFRAYVKANFDTDGNGSLSKAEANSVESFHIGNGTYNDDPVVLCKNMKGIEHFPNLEDLGISGSEGKRHPLKSLDLSKNKKLVNLVVKHTNIKKLDLRKNKGLFWLFASDNKLTKLSLGEKKKLIELYCDQNSLSKLDLTKCKNLAILNCSDNKLSSLNLAKNKKLNTLNASGNSRLKKLDIGKCAKLVNSVKKDEQTSKAGYVQWRDPKEDDPDAPEWSEKYNYRLRIPAKCKLYNGKKVLYKGK